MNQQQCKIKNHWNVRGSGIALINTFTTLFVPNDIFKKLLHFNRQRGARQLMIVYKIQFYL